MPRSPVEGSRLKQTPVAAVVALVPEHHLHHVHGGPEVLGDLVGLPVHACARRVPRVEDRADRAQQLLVCVEREWPARLVLVDLACSARSASQVGRRQLDVLVDAALGLELRERLLEAVRVDALDDLAVHLDQAAVGVVGEARVRRGRGKPERRSRR